MIEVEQTKFGGPEHPVEERGNCFNACLASLLEVPITELPDASADESGWDQIIDWLNDRGYGLCWLQGHDEEKGYWPGYTIAGVESFFYVDVTETGGGHVVVAKDGMPVWNPSPKDPRTLEELRKAKDGWYYFLYPLDPSVKK